MKKKSLILLIIGLVLIISSIVLVVVQQIKMNLGIEKGHSVLSQIEAVLPERSAGVPGIYPTTAMPVMQINGEDYVAIVEVPAFGVKLPVADAWDSNQLYTSPRRYYGSAYQNTLAIGGSDHKKQFSFCSEISNGSIVRITDMTGAQFTYSVARIDRAANGDAAWLANSDFDLTLFCRDTLSLEYIAVRCNFAYK